MDIKPFVFTDSAQRPYLCRLWEDTLWLFYWHHDHWVSLRDLTIEEYNSFPRNLSSVELDKYDNMHREWELRQKGLLKFVITS